MRGRIRFGRSVAIVRLALVAGLVAVVAATALGRAGRAEAADGGCTPQLARTAFATFVAAFNAGRYQQLDTLFAQPPQFRRYASRAPGLRSGAASRKRGSLLAYFRSRHLKRDRLRLVTFRFAGTASGLDTFTFTLRRSAADYRRGAWFTLGGSGAAVCVLSNPYVEQPVQFTALDLGAPRGKR